MEAIAGGLVTGDADDGRASKKKVINKLSSSVQKVLSNDDLLIEILLLLPLLSLRLFKRVSKHWLSLITSPTFTFRRTQISDFSPPSGLFILRDASSCPYDFLSFNSRKKIKVSTFTYVSETSSTKLLIEQSCNGLLMCRDYNNHYFIYNPLISKFKMLPPTHPLDNYLPSSRFNDFRMAFDPTKSPHYNVVHVGGVPDVAHVYGPSIRIQTYSSETGVWSVSDDRFPSRSFGGFCNGVYWNGAIHWLNNRNDPLHFKLEIVDRLVLTHIQTPKTLEGEVHYRNDRKLFGSSGSLLLCKANYRFHNLKVYEMKNGCSEWSMKYIVNLDNLLRRTRRFYEERRCYNIWSIFFGEREEESFMVIELSGKVLQYKFVSATVTKLLDVGKGADGWRCHDFIASFAHV